jgi:hypothetical protein
MKINNVIQIENELLFICDKDIYKYKNNIFIFNLIDYKNTEYKIEKDILYSYNKKHTYLPPKTDMYTKQIIYEYKIEYLWEESLLNPIRKLTTEEITPYLKDII